MFELRALCTSYKCGQHEFTRRKSRILRTSTSNQVYQINRLVCPRCGMWAEIQDVKEVV